MHYEPIAQLTNLSGKTALVTGAAAGIGYGIAYRLAEAGATTIIVDIDAAAADAAARKIHANGFKAFAYDCDVSKHQAVETMTQNLTASHPGVDILVNNAGIYPFIPLLELHEIDFDRIVEANLKSVYLCTQFVANNLIAQNKSGKIINITSVDAIHPSSTGLAVYDATKHAVWGFTKNIALELAPHAIWVNAIAPGSINTREASAQTVSKETEERRREFIDRVPMKRMGDPDDIARAALFLASDLSSYMTGSQIVVDGGLLLT